jgi:Flp pilus assembly protein TadD
MHKNARVGLLVACGVAISVWLALRARRAEDANALLAQAERLLHPPLTEAASFRDVRAREARELCEESAELSDGERGRKLMLEAESVEAFQRGAYDRAEKLLASSPARAQDPQLLLLSAAVSLARADAASAEKWLGRMPESERNSVHTLLVRSDVERGLGHADQALAAAEGGIAQAPGVAALYERRGLAYELLGDGARAQSDLERAAQLDPRGSAPLLALGRLQRGRGQLEAAVLAFHEAAQRSPEEGEAWLGSGVCRAALGDVVAARVDLERAAELAPKRAEPLIALADLDVAEKHVSHAIARYRAALMFDPSSALAGIKLGNALMRAGDIAEAIPVFRAAIERRPDMAAAHNGLGAAFVARGELDSAEAELKDAARLDPRDPHPWLNLARLYKQRGNSAAQSEALARAQASGGAGP